MLMAGARPFCGPICTLCEAGTLQLAWLDTAGGCARVEAGVVAGVEGLVDVTADVEADASASFFLSSWTLCRILTMPGPSKF